MVRTIVGAVVVVASLSGVACAHRDGPSGGAAPAAGGVRLTSGGAPASVTSSTSPMRGVFRTRADAATFEDCGSGRSFPVAMEGGYLALERAARAAAAPGGIVATVRGHVEPRERGDGAGDPSGAASREETLVVDDVVSTTEDTASCAGATSSSASLTGTRWVLVELDGQPVAPPAEPNAQPASLVFAVVPMGAGLRLSGYGGCNTLRARWSTAAASPPSATAGPLRIEALSSTRRACPSMAAETALSNALTSAQRFEVTGASLVLYDDMGARARFEAKDTP